MMVGSGGYICSSLHIQNIWLLMTFHSAKLTFSKWMNLLGSCMNCWLVLELWFTRYKFGSINNLQSKSAHYLELHNLCSQPRLRFMPPQNSLGYFTFNKAVTRHWFIFFSFFCFGRAGVVCFDAKGS